MVINQIIPEDDAIYQCMAENSQGSILSRARLTVVMSEDRPSAPYNVHAETMSSSAILLAWERPLYNSDKVIAYSVHYMKAEGKQLEECLSLSSTCTHGFVFSLNDAYIIHIIFFSHNIFEALWHLSLVCQVYLFFSKFCSITSIYFGYINIA